MLDDELPVETNDFLSSVDVKPIQAFRISNISKMALVLTNTLPGNWLGVGAVAHILCHLNRLFRPLCSDFQICVQNMGNISFERIARKMMKHVDVNYISKEFSARNLDNDEV